MIQNSGKIEREWTLLYEGEKTSTIPYGTIILGANHLVGYKEIKIVCVYGASSGMEKASIEMDNVVYSSSICFVPFETQYFGYRGFSIDINGNLISKTNGYFINHTSLSKNDARCIPVEIYAR